MHTEKVMGKKPLSALRAWLESLPREADAPGHTAEELAQAWGCNINTARRWLRALCKAGTHRQTGYRSVTRPTDGRRQRVSVYDVAKK
jgi:response regulator of citrate/malate metabolism